MTDFVSWLVEEMERKGISPAQLARRGEISETQISRIISRQRTPGNKALSAIARGLDMPPELIYQKANLMSVNLPPDARISPEATEIATITLALADDDRALLVDFARLLYRRAKR